MTLSEITESVHVDATPDEVWSVVTDVRRHPEFAGPKSITKEIEFEGPLEIGAHWLAHEKFGPQTFDAPSEVTMVDPAHDFSWVSLLPVREKSRGTGGRVYWDYHLEPEGEGTRLSHHMRVEEPARGAVSLKALYKVLNMPKRQREGILTSLGNIKDVAEHEHPHGTL
ncbi:SRPBCC family protein [Streptomyces sp. KR80]|uniref:SRPBCC family protein n=1 Tax=Streptomyces sp. KR80 TaxID=3457426 RepID=UPI003FD3E950